MTLTCTCVWLAISSSIAARAQTATTTQASVATASFAYISDDGCVENDVIVLANSTTVVSSGQPTTTLAVTYSRHRYDSCENSDLGTDMGSSPRPLFSGDLDRASLNVTMSGNTTSGSV